MTTTLPARSAPTGLLSARSAAVIAATAAVVA
jgi:hypothetical protein